MTDRFAHIDESTAALIRAVIDDRATPDQCAELECIMLDDAGVRAYYLRSVQVDASLQWEHAAGHRAAPARAAEPEPSYRISSVFLGIAAALLLAAASVGVYFVATDRASGPEGGAPVPVATLIETSGGGLQTPHDYPSEGRQYSAGAYALDAGSAEFMLTSAVNVTLRGHTRMLIHDDMAVSLQRGGADFVVPRGAIGFTVHLPDRSKIVDLGTAFKVRVDDAGHAEIKVTQGMVRWMPTADVAAGHVANPVLVHAGQRVRMIDGRVERLSDQTLLADSFESAKSLRGWNGAGPRPDATVGSPPAPWVATGPVGSWWPTTVEYPAGGADGDICLFFNNAAVVRRTLTEPVQPNTTYTLTVAVGNRADHRFPGYGIELWAGDTKIASDYDARRGGTGAAPAPGTWKDATATVTTGDTVSGRPLEVRLRGYGIQTNYDNVRLEATRVVTEPAGPKDETSRHVDEK